MCKSIFHPHVFFLLLLFIIIGNPDNSFSQTCPPGTPPPSGPGTPGWTFGGCVPVTVTYGGQTCVFDVCWCYRVVTTTSAPIYSYLQYTLSSITPQDIDCFNDMNITDDY